MYGLGLCPLIDRPSRITTNWCTLIYNIFTNQINYSVRNGLLINDISDHLPIFALCNSNLSNVWDRRISKKKDMANELKMIFSNVGHKLAKNITNPDENIAAYDYLGTCSRIENVCSENP